MLYQEFSDIFDVLYNNITSNQAAGLTEYEKSVFLTKAQNEIVKNYFTATSKGNNIGQGFDDSAKRQADFSCLMKTATCTQVTNVLGTNVLITYVFTPTEGSSIQIPSITATTSGDDPVTLPAGTYTISISGNDVTATDSNSNTYNIIDSPITADGDLIVVYTTVTTGKIDTHTNTTLWQFPSDVFIPINESIKCISNKNLQVIPLRYDEYVRLMSKPYKRPVKYQAWRLINFGQSSAIGSDKYAEIIIGPNDTIAPNGYSIRYVRFPRPIIVGPLDGLTIDNYCFTGDSISGATETAGCELDPIIHEDILQRAVELAKIAWTSTGQDNTQSVIQAGQRSE